MSDQPYPAFLASSVNAVKHALAAEQTSNLPSTPATSFATSLPMAATLGGVPALVRLCLLANSMLKPRAWQPLALVFDLSLRLFALPRSKVGLILLYLHLPHRYPPLHLPPIPWPWPLPLASAVFLRWPKRLFRISLSLSAPDFWQFLRKP